jgi:hypothetical protein
MSRANDSGCGGTFKAKDITEQEQEVCLELLPEKSPPVQLNVHELQESWNRPYPY